MEDALDRRLVRNYLSRREERAFRELYRRHASVMYGVAVRVAGGPGPDAEEIVQSAWIRAAERLESFRWESSLRSWLVGIVLNCARETVRAAGRRVRAEDRDGAPLPPAGGSGGAGMRLDLERAIAALPPGYREVLILHDVEGFTHAEIGNLLGIAGGTSKSRLSRARRAVRTWLAGGESPEREETEAIDERRAV